MAIYTQLPVYKLSYALLLDVTRTLAGTARDCRYTLGQDLRQRLMDIIVLIYRANRMRHKVKIISSMRESLLEAQVYIRMMSDMRYISEGKYAALAEQTTVISKQMAAWEKSEREKDRDSGEPGGAACD